MSTAPEDARRGRLRITIGQAPRAASAAWSLVAYSRVAARGRWSAEQVDAYQARRLRRALARAADESPFLRRRRPREIHDLHAWPLITRAELQSAAPTDVLAAGVRRDRCSALTTSGSTGQPLTMFYSTADLRERWLYFVRMFRAYGLPFICRIAQVGQYRASRVHRAGSSGLDRRSFLSLRDDVDRRLDLLRAAGSEAMMGYTDDIAEMARRAAERGDTFPELRTVIGVGEQMTARHRETIARGFGAAVRDSYGAVEAGAIAYECPSGSGTYHVHADNLVVEILNDGRPAAPGETGSVFITHLNYRAMPLVRYEVGDLATAGACACGSGLPALTRLEGRTDDVVTLSSGRTLTPHAISNLFCGSGLRRFRLRQHGRGRFTLDLDGEHDEINRAERALRARLDPDDQLVVNRTSLPAGGRKTRAIVVEAA